MDTTMDRFIHCMFVAFFLVLFGVPLGFGANAFFAGDSNLDYVRHCAPQAWSRAGFESEGYNGYQHGLTWSDYGGARVWYTATREDNPGVIYEGYVQRWGDECHLYEVRAIDAIGGKL